MNRIVQSGLQHAGDLITLRGDTLHWVRALGFSTHFSWNYGIFEDSQVFAAPVVVTPVTVLWLFTPIGRGKLFL